MTEEAPETTGSSSSILMSENWLWDLYNSGNAHFTCEICGEVAKLVKKGARGTTGKYHEVICKDKDCGHINSDKPKTSNLHEGVPIHLLKAVLSCLLGDITPDAFSAILTSLGLKAPGPEYYYSLINILYEEFREVINGILRENRAKVAEYYEKNNHKAVNGKHNICCSCDGCYTRRSFQSLYLSRFCISFMIECITGTIVDMVVVERCVSDTCRDQEQWTMNDCPDGKFHGCSKSLEVSCALLLYERSTAPDFPFRYTTYVGDGDSNVINNVLDHTPPFYGPDFPIRKEECVFHFRKRVKKHITACLLNIRVTTVKAGVITEQKKQYNKKKNQKDPFTVDYSKLVDKNFNHNNPFSKSQLDMIPVRMANLIQYCLRKAIVKRKADNTPEPEMIQYMSKVIRAIPRHYCDHNGATLAQRNRYHELCEPEFCKFLQKN